MLMLLVGEVNPREINTHFRKSICDALDSTLHDGAWGSSVSVLSIRSMGVFFARTGKMLPLQSISLHARRIFATALVPMHIA